MIASEQRRLQSPIYAVMSIVFSIDKFFKSLREKFQKFFVAYQWIPNTFPKNGFENESLKIDVLHETHWTNAYGTTVMRRPI